MLDQTTLRTSQLRRRRDLALRRAASLAIEPLETRRLLATIEGTVWNDIDNDGLFDYFEDGRPGVTVYIDSNQNGALDDGEPTRITNSQGNYRFENLPVGEYFIGHVYDVEGEELKLAQTSPGISGRTNVQSAFNIDIIYANNTLNPEQKAIIETAVAKWEQVIIGDAPDVTVGGRVIDDLEIVVTGGSVDGPGGVLAFARPSAFRSPEPGTKLQDFQGNPVGLPYRGEITVDLIDSGASRGFVETVVHEIGHVLGIGGFWDGFLIGRGTPGVSYVGEAAVRETNRIFNSNVSTVPVEVNTEGHWREGFGAENPGTNLGTELMTPFSEGGFELPPDAQPVAPLSRITIGAMEDFGWEVNYAGAEHYGPFNIGPLPEDLLPELGFRPFQIGVVLETEDQVEDTANFGVRLNTRPSPFHLTAGPVIQQVGEPVRLLMELDNLDNPQFSGDPDFRDALIQVNFYRESNGVPGLQTNVDVARGIVATADTFLGEDADRTDGFEINADTTGLALGETIFYARAFDQGYAVRDRLVTVDLVTGQTTPTKPESIQAIGTDARTILVNWIDASTDENGFLLQVSKSADFDITADITNIWLPPQEGTGPYTYELDVPDGQLQTRHFRVRSYNTGGSSPFAGRVTARTLSRNEVLVDNESEGQVDNTGDWDQTVDRANAVNLTYLTGTSGFVDFRPMLQEAGEYFIFVRNPNLNTPGSITVTVFSDDGIELDSVDIDQQASRNSNVQVGKFMLTPDSFVRISHAGGTARADTVRFLPVG